MYPPIFAKPAFEKTKAGGFTLIELLVVIAIIAVLVALALPALNRAKTRAATAKCGANVRRIAEAIQLYAADNDGNLPYNFYNPGALWWHREIAPYIGFDWDNVMKDPWLKESRLPDLFHCPADPWWGKTYAVDPSYGCNNVLLKTIPGGGFPVGTPRRKLVSVERPSEMLLLADTGHAEEDGDAAWRIGPSLPSQALLGRHDGCGTVGWLDGHVTLETAARLKELNSEKPPWPHWRVP